MECRKKNINEPATVADHIVSLTDDWTLRLDLNNIQGLCDRCHNIKSARELQRYKTGNVYTSTKDKMNELNDFK
jgi:5-methylcytosine-specific restriction endonuclease McrA